MNGQKQISLIILSVEKSLELERSVFILQLENLFINFLCILLISVVLFLVQFDEVVGLVNVGDEFLKRKKCVLYGINLGENRISFLLVTPKVRFKCLLFKLCEFRS